MLSKEPSARYRTADQLGRVLLRFGTEAEVNTAPELSLTPETSPGYQPEYDPAEHLNLEEDASSEGIDWVTVALGLLALIAVGGLVPFWLWIYIKYNPPVR